MGLRTFWRYLVGRIQSRGGREVSFLDDGLVIREGECERVIPWERIDGILVEKEDVLTIDTVAMLFRVKTDVLSGQGGGEIGGEGEGDEYIRVTEDLDGFGESLVVLANRFGIPESEWWGKIAKPPLEEKRIVLWERSPVRRVKEADEP